MVLVDLYTLTGTLCYVSSIAPPLAAILRKFAFMILFEANTLEQVKSSVYSTHELTYDSCNRSKMTLFERVVGDYLDTREDESRVLVLPYFWARPI